MIVATAELTAELTADPTTAHDETHPAGAVQAAAPFHQRAALQPAADVPLLTAQRAVPEGRPLDQCRRRGLHRRSMGGVEMPPTGGSISGLSTYLRTFFCRMPSAVVVLY